MKLLQLFIVKWKNHKFSYKFDYGGITSFGANGIFSPEHMGGDLVLGLRATRASLFFFIGCVFSSRKCFNSLYCS